MEVGDRVKLVGMPPALPEDAEFKTRSLFEKCLGKTFIVAGFQNVEGLSYALVQLDVGDVLGEASYMHSIFVEPECLQVVQTV